MLINGETKEVPQNFILIDENGNRYVEIKSLVEFVGFQYFNGEYLKTTEDKNKCYINNKDNIVGFENESDIIYKTQVNSSIEYQNYKLTKPIISYNNSLYISTEDVPKSLNIFIYFDAEKNQTQIYTTDYIIQSMQKEYDDNNSEIKIDTAVNNENAIIYNLLVIESKSKYGVLNYSNRDEVLIGNKYNSLSYDEYTGTFVA